MLKQLTAFCVGYAAWLALMPLIWFAELIAIPRTAMIGVVLLAYLASLVPSTIDSFIDGFLTWSVALMPMISTGLWAIGYKMPCKAMVSSPLKLLSAPQVQNKSGALHLSFDIHPLPIYFACFVLIGGIVRGILNNGSFINTSSASVNLVTHIISIVLATIMSFIVSRSRTSTLDIRRSWLLLFAFLLAGLLLISFSSIRMIDFIPLGRSMLIAGNTCLTVLFWILLVFILSEYKECAWMSGLYVIVGAISSLNSYLFAPAFTQYLDITPQDQLFLFPLMIAFALTMLSVAFLHYVFQDGRQNKTSDHLTMSETLSMQYGLTKREAEIATLIAQGNSFDAVAERLELAPNTVRSYSKAIYRKLGVHKKQEIINLTKDISLQEKLETPASLP